MRREIIQKQTFLNEFLALQDSVKLKTLEKVNDLSQDPLPNGLDKIKLHRTTRRKRKLYRCKFGRYRLFYQFGEEWVSILAIRQRNERTYDVENISGTSAQYLDTASENAAELIAQWEIEQDEALLFDPQSGFDQRNDVEEESSEESVEESLSSPLPFALTKAFLTNLLIPQTYFSAILACQDEDDLLGLVLPDHLHTRLVNNIYPQSIDEIENGPDFILQDPEDLLKFKDGELTQFLLRLDEEQKKVVEFAMQGPSLIKGGAGTGKSTIALYRVKAILETNPNAKVLFVTYTNALQNGSHQLLQQLLTTEQFAQVDVLTVDKHIFNVLKAHRRFNGKQAANDVQMRNAMKNAIQKLGVGDSLLQRTLKQQSIKSLSSRYVQEEIFGIIEGNALSKDEYMNFSRVGRKIVFRQEIRETMWEYLELVRDELKRQGVVSRTALALEALQALKDGSVPSMYDNVLIDEAQDLSMVHLAVMVESCHSPSGLCLAADMKQSIYSVNSWSQRNDKLNLRGRTRVLQTNYRSTEQIDTAAYDVLSTENEDRKISKSVHQGPNPSVWIVSDTEPEVPHMIRYIQAELHRLHMPRSAVAILVPNAQVGKVYEDEFVFHGEHARFYSSDKLELDAKMMKIMTLHTAKGLEFPIVVLAGFTSGSYPERQKIQSLELYHERDAQFRRLLYVGMTRAMRSLLVIRTVSCQCEPLLQLSSENWTIQTL